MTEPTDDELDAVIAEYRTRIYPQDMHPRFERAIMRAAIAKWGTPPAVAGEPVAWRYRPSAVWEDYVLTDDPEKAARARGNGRHVEALCLATPHPTQPQAGAVPLTDREIELIDGMIQVQLDHASRCDAIANRSMADKQKGWDMERVALLQKFKAHGIKGGQHEPKQID